MTDQQVSAMTDEALAVEIASKISSSPVLLFMKGTPDDPYCGFSMRTAAALDEIGASYAAVNVLADPRIREVLIEQHGWPTVPQLYVDGALVGGCDIVTEMAESGELKELIASAGRA